MFLKNDTTTNYMEKINYQNTNKNFKKITLFKFKFLHGV